MAKYKIVDFNGVVKVFKDGIDYTDKFSPETVGKLKSSLLNDTEYTEDEFNHFAGLSGIDLGSLESDRTSGTMFDKNTDDSVLDKESSLYKQRGWVSGLIKDNIGKIAIGTIGAALAGTLAGLFFGSDKDEVVPGSTPAPANATDQGGATTNPTDEQLKDAARIKTLEKIAYGAPTVDVDETYRNMKSEYDSKFKMNADKARELMTNSNKKAIELANNMYDNSVVTFFDRIYQGLGMSNGQTGAAMLQSNQKLKADMSQLMEGSALLAMSMGEKNEGKSFQMRAEGARQIMDVVTPGTWDKIADNAIKAAAGITSVAMHNAQARQQSAEKQMSAIIGKYAKDGTADKNALEIFKQMSDFNTAMLGSKDPSIQKNAQTLQETNLNRFLKSIGTPVSNSDTK